MNFLFQRLGVIKACLRVAPAYCAWASGPSMVREQVGRSDLLRELLDLLLDLVL